jgi:hypothetical protein
MEFKKIVIGAVGVGLTAPYLWAALTDPAGPNEKPSRAALMALQNMVVSTSSTSAGSHLVVIDTVLGKAIDVGLLQSAIARYPRPSFIAPPVTLSST